MATGGSKRSAALLAMALVATAYLVARGGDAHRATAIVLLLEPVFWVGAVWTAYASWAGGRSALAFALVLSAMSAATLVRVVAQAPVPVLLAPPSMSRLRSCARSLTLPSDAVRIARWHLSANEGSRVAVEILATKPDIVVLTGAPQPAVVDAVAAELGGELVALQTPEGAAVFLGRGVFHRCGDDDGWTDVPAPGTGSAFVFAGIPSETTIPILLVQSPDPLTEPAYDAAIVAERGRTAAFVGELASSLLVVLSDGGPGRGLGDMLRTGGMSKVERRLNWPAQLFGLPWPVPLHSLDHAWFAGAWRSGGSRLLKAPQTSRHGVVFDLAPAVAFGRGAGPTIVSE